MGTQAKRPKESTDDKKDRDLRQNTPSDSTSKPGPPKTVDHPPAISGKPNRPPKGSAEAGNPGQPLPPATPGSSCKPGGNFPRDFQRIVGDTLGGIGPMQCSGDPNAGGASTNEDLGNTVLAQLNAAYGCKNKFMVLVWAGTHGSDHQGANVQTYQSGLCDGGMYGIEPGPKCLTTGGTYHRFCTGVGKSYAVFIHPSGRATKNVDIPALALSCADHVGLLIDFTKCMNDNKASPLRGVIVIPRVGIPAPKGGAFRPNEWKATECTTGGWLFCGEVTVGGRDLQIFAVQPLA